MYFRWRINVKNFFKTTYTILIKKKKKRKTEYMCSMYVKASP